MDLSRNPDIRLVTILPVSELVGAKGYFYCLFFPLCVYVGILFGFFLFFKAKSIKWCV